MLCCQDMAFEGRLDGAVSCGERCQHVAGTGADALIHLVADAFDEGGALDLGGHEGVDGWGPVDPHVGAGARDPQASGLDEYGEFVEIAAHEVRAQQ
jgi:hypothetical protein